MSRPESICALTSEGNDLLRVEISTFLSPDIRKYIWLRIPDSEEVDPANFLPSRCANWRKSCGDVCMRFESKKIIYTDIVPGAANKAL